MVELKNRMVKATTFTKNDKRKPEAEGWDSGKRKSHAQPVNICTKTKVDLSVVSNVVTWDLFSTPVLL